VLDEHKLGDLRTYLLERMQVTRHPFDPENTAKVHRFQNLTELVNVLLGFLALECSEEQVASVGSDFVQAFYEYSTATPLEWEQSKGAVDLLVVKFEAFLKKMFYCRWPGEAIPRGLHNLLTCDKTISLGIRPAALDVDSWRQQPTRVAVVGKVYLMRNPTAHEARLTESLELSMHSILAACLFVVEENLDLLKRVIWKQTAEEWTAYLRHVIRRCDDAQWEEKKYLWPRVGDIDLMAQMNGFLDDETRSVLLIVGRPGAGKTAFLKRWANLLAERALASLEATGSVRPAVPVPVYVDLNGYVADQQSYFVLVDSGLVKHIRSDMEGLYTDWEQFFLGSPANFVVLLDALDEMKRGQKDPDEWGHSLQTIKNLIDSRAISKAVSACRDGVLPGPWRQRYEILSISPLTVEDIRNYCYAHLGESAETAYNYMASPERRELLELMRIPLMLQATVEYWRQFELPPAVSADDSQDKSEALAPSLGKLVDLVFEQVLEWEHNKSSRQGWSLEPLNWKERLSELAYWMDGRMSYASLSSIHELGFISIEDLICFQNMGVLRRGHHGLGFFNMLTRAYFAALKLKRIIEEGEEATLPPDYQDHRSFWRRCIELLQEVTYRDVNTLLRQVIA
jgi:hypothetical protein